jgi:transcriptional regulator with XRE-family HTH domain
MVPTSFKSMNKKEDTKRRKEDKIKKEFGLHLRNLRLSKNLTLRDLDALTGIDYSSIGKSENGTRNTPVQDLYALAEALKVNIAELFPLIKV